MFFDYEEFKSLAEKENLIVDRNEYGAVYFGDEKTEGEKLLGYVEPSFNYKTMYIEIPKKEQIDLDEFKNTKEMVDYIIKSSKTSSRRPIKSSRYYIVYYTGGTDDGYVRYDNRPTIDFDNAMIFDSEQEANEWIDDHSDEWKATLKVVPYPDFDEIDSSRRPIKSDWERTDMASGPIWDKDNWRIIERRGHFADEDEKWYMLRDKSHLFKDDIRFDTLAEAMDYVDFRANLNSSHQIKSSRRPIKSNYVIYYNDSSSAWGRVRNGKLPDDFIDANGVGLVINPNVGAMQFNSPEEAKKWLEKHEDEWNPDWGEILEVDENGELYDLEGDCLTSSRKINSAIDYHGMSVNGINYKVIDFAFDEETYDNINQPDTSFTVVIRTDDEYGYEKLLELSRSHDRQVMKELACDLTKSINESTGNSFEYEDLAELVDADSSDNSLYYMVNVFEPSISSSRKINSARYIATDPESGEVLGSADTYEEAVNEWGEDVTITDSEATKGQEEGGLFQSRKSVNSGMQHKDVSNVSPDSWKDGSELPRKNFSNMSIEVFNQDGDEVFYDFEAKQWYYYPTHKKALVEKWVEKNLVNSSRKITSAVDGGWEVRSSDVPKALDLFVEYFGEETALEEIAKAMGDNVLEENLEWIARQWGFAENIEELDDAWDKYETAKEIMGVSELFTNLTQAAGYDELAEDLAFIFRMNDFREWDKYD